MLRLYIFFAAAALTTSGCGSGGGGSAAPAANPPILSGLDQRPANSSCVAPTRSGGTAGYSVVDAFPTAPSMSRPTKFIQAPGQAMRWYALEKSGRIQIFDTSDPAAARTWLDLSSVVNDANEGGLLGIAFPPNFPVTPEVYVSYTGNPGGAMISYVSRVLLDDIDTPVNPIEQRLVTVNQDFENHNGGNIAFGADGYLYFGLGDGGSGNDPNNRAQDTTRLLGSLLRIDVLGVAFPVPGYTIPGDNPFAGNAVCGPAGNAASCPEIYAWGLRNPWRWSFDAATGELWLGDVGQGAWEEVDRIERGGNYGWRCREGANDAVTAGCPASGLIDPVAQYSHANGDVSITGGHVYRGSAIPDLNGRYVFGDFASGRIWALADDGQGGFNLEELLDSSLSISDFALGNDGELYVADYGGGRLYRLIATISAPTDPVPEDLAATGCVDTSDPTRPADGTIPYAVNAEFWSDGALKTRHLALPNGTTIEIDANDDWQLPPGSVLIKSFRLGATLVETRLLMRHPDGDWAGYTYEWNASATQATRVRGGKTLTVGTQDYAIPSEGECLQCHTSVAGVSLGVETAQLNSDLTYPTTGRTANQLATHDAIGTLTTPLPDPTALPTLANPSDTTASLSERARAYLHTNCAQCHRPNGPTSVDIDLRYTTGLDTTGACDAPPQTGELGINNARIIAPGDASRSVLIARMNRRDANGMPPVASLTVDNDGVGLVSDWINGLSGCL